MKWPYFSLFEACLQDELLKYNATYTAGIEQTKDALALGLPRLRLFASVAIPLAPNIVASAQIIKDRDYDSDDMSGGATGSGEDAHSLIFQLATRFWVSWNKKFLSPTFWSIFVF